MKESKSGAEQNIVRKTAIAIPVFNPAMEPIEKAVVAGERRGEKEFNRNVIGEEIQLLGSGYESAIQGIAEGLNAKRRVEEEQIGSRKSLMKTLLERMSSKREGKGFTKSPKFPFTVGYHREEKRIGGQITPDYYIQELSPDGAKTIDSSLKLEFTNGRISLLKYSGDINMNDWILDQGFHHSEFYSSKLWDTIHNEEEKRAHELKRQLPVIEKIYYKREDRDFRSLSISLKLPNADGSDPVLLVEDDRYFSNKPYYSGQYHYEFHENQFKLQRDSYLDRGEKISDYEWKNQPFAKTISVSPTEVMLQMLDLIPAEKR